MFSEKFFVVSRGTGIQIRVSERPRWHIPGNFVARYVLDQYAFTCSAELWICWALRVNINYWVLGYIVFFFFFVFSRNPPLSTLTKHTTMFVRCSWSVVIALVLVALGSVPTRGNRVGLYEDSDLMEILDSTNFEEQVVEGNTSFVVEFYNSFCGHCIRFSTPWKEFGIQVYGKRLLITFYI